MEGKYPIMIDDALAGTLEVTKKGAMTVFDARCKGTDKLLRLSVYGDDSEGYLGVMVPEGGEMRLRRTMSPLSMRGFPEEIVAAGPAGRGNAGQQGVAEEPAPPRSDSGKTMTDRAEKPETAPPESPREDCGETLSSVPPETGSTPEPEETKPSCEKCPEPEETKPSCEKCPEPEETKPPCEKRPEPEETKPPCKKPPEQQAEDPPCEKVPEPAGGHRGHNKPAGPAEAEDVPENPEDLCWYASPDGALVCFDGVHSLIALPPADERVPGGIPGRPRRIEGRDYLVYETKNGRIVS